MFGYVLTATETNGGCAHDRRTKPPGQFGSAPGARVRTPQERNAIPDPAIGGRSKPGRPGRTVTDLDLDVRSLYLALIRRYLTRYGMRERMPAQWPLRRRLPLKTLNTLNPTLFGASPFGERKRDLGRDWPAEAETMIGMQRLTSLQHCVETVLADDIPGDLVECGVWRGGACILMRAVLAAYGDETRCVWLADSFQGLPRPDSAKYKADKRIRLHRCAGILGVSEAEVRTNFERYGLLDDQVRFLPGWFKDTLPDAPIDRIALLRLDGDLYESTIQALDALYPRLSPGGFCIIDDYHIKACRQAVADYRAKHGVSGEIVDIDGWGALWRK
jgi:O-methyltransferase